mmetsp:Transcript_34815/g.75199  ORF Transcript_34815/g.75199 Transcript_34815/m.75199 type:complete len:207 (+) Transcript_34815:34-654(+)
MSRAYTGAGVWGSATGRGCERTLPAPVPVHVRVPVPVPVYMRLLICLALQAIVAEAKRKQKPNPKAFFYVTAGIIVFFFLLLTAYCVRELCPHGTNFSSLELDEIRLDSLDDVESSLQTNINALKDRLAFHRKKKTLVQTDRDIKRRLEERVGLFHDRGRSVYGEAWDEGDIPVNAQGRGKDRPLGAVERNGTGTGKGPATRRQEI